MDKNKHERGITLVALIITVVIMLILVAVTIQVVISSGLLSSTNKAGKDYQATIEEEANMSKVNINGTEHNSIEEYVGTKPENPDVPEVPKLPEIGAGEKAETNSKYQTAIIPAGFTVSGRPEEQTIDGGLVIYDIPETVDTSSVEFWTKTTEVGDQTYPTVQTEYNQFVWVPVDTPYVTKEKLAEIITNDETGEITDETKALQSLADNGTYPMAVKVDDTDYRGVLYGFSEGTKGVDVNVWNFSSTDNYNDGSVTYNREPAILKDSNPEHVDQEKEAALDLQTEYNNIVNSVNANKGFWVARYELSYSATGESKRGKTVTTALDTNTNQWYGLYNACKLVSTTERASSTMITGSQWHQIMIWMKEVKNTKAPGKYYILYSNSMGNYSKALGGTGAKQVSGYKNEYQVKQIFDLGGNVFDFTSEAIGSAERTARGESYGTYSSNGYLGVLYSHRNYPLASPNVTARAAIYLKL